jgi:hypothetical protein
MTVYNFGSINADYFYQVPHIPALGRLLRRLIWIKAWAARGPINLWLWFKRVRMWCI